MKILRKNSIVVLVLLLLAGLVAHASFGKTEHRDLALVPQDNMASVDEGHFLMGSENGSLDEEPVHEVRLASFMMDKYEVTYAEYKGFLEENPEWRKGKVDIDFASLDYLHDWEALSYPEERDNHPIVYISWYAAMAYAEWAGKTLPTEAQWEYASRGSFKNMDYPWGKEFKSHLTRWRGSKLAGSAQVGRYTINGFGLHDVIGNAGEWTSDGYELYQPGAQINPSSPLNRHLKVIRGGSWKSAQADLRVSARRAYAPNICLPDVGFRCVLAL